MVTDHRANRTQAQRTIMGLGRGSNTHSRDVVDNTFSTKTSAVMAARLHVDIVAGVDEQNSDTITLDGVQNDVAIATGDTIIAVSVLELSEDQVGVQSVVSRSRAASDFTAADGYITPAANLEDNYGNFYAITWLDLSA